MNCKISEKNCVAAQRAVVAVCIILVMTGCALLPGWHWEKPGATDGEYDADIKYCKLQVYPGVDGMVTKESVRRMHACMEARGWRKAEN